MSQAINSAEADPHVPETVWQDVLDNADVLATNVALTEVEARVAAAIVIMKRGTGRGRGGRRLNCTSLPCLLET
jgi:hypothetical protein